MKNDLEVVAVEGQEFGILGMGTGHRVYKAYESRVLSFDGDMIGQVDVFPNGRGMPILHYRLIGKDWKPLVSCYTHRDAALVLINAYLAQSKHDAKIQTLMSLCDVPNGL